ncbi:MAG: helix-turn-helix transcriptional regulator [Phycisphaeraceae bacterium JB051]
MGKQRFKRLIEMITFIQSNANVSIYDIMNEFKISRSTAFRDLSLLESCGVPYFFDPHKGYQICSSYMLPINDLNIEECIALAGLYTQLRQNINDPNTELAVKAFQKLLALLPQSMRDMYEHSSTPHMTIIEERNHENAKFKQNVSMFLEAIDKRSPIMCELNKSMSGRKQVRLHPYHLIAFDSQWYVWGKVQPAGVLCSIALEEIHRPVITENRFHKPPAHIVNAWKMAWRIQPSGILYEVKVQVDKAAPGFLTSKQWHHTQELMMHDSGNMTLCFEVDGLDEIAEWVWQYHNYLHVLQPIALKQKLYDRARQVMSL